MSPGAQRYLETIKECLGAHTSSLSAAQTPLSIAIVGGGICGLSSAIALSRTGHNVTVFEAEPNIPQTGAGIQLAPNATRQLWRWGLGKYLEDVCVHPESLMTRRWSDGRAIGMFKTGELLRKTGSPYIQVHRGDLNTGLQRLALRQGVNIRPNSKVVKYDHAAGDLKLISGETFTADLIIAADGIHSLARRDLDEDKQVNTAEWVAYRTSLSTEIIRRDKELAWMVEKPHQNSWLGPGRHCQAYSMRANDLYNLVFIAPFSPSRDPSQFKTELLTHFGHWDPRLAKLLSLTGDDNVGKWPLWIRQHAKKWHQRNGKVTLLGDAAHDMSPWLAQGAAMSIEDSACLEVLLTQVRSSWQKTGDLSSVLEILHAFRSARTAQIRAQAEETAQIRHLPDGESQKQRDAAAAEELEDAEPQATPYIFTSQEGKHWLYEYDVTRAFLQT